MTPHTWLSERERESERWKTLFGFGMCKGCGCRFVVSKVNFFTTDVEILLSLELSYRLPPTKLYRWVNPRCWRFLGLWREWGERFAKIFEVPALHCQKWNFQSLSTNQAKNLEDFITKCVQCIFVQSFFFFLSLLCGKRIFFFFFKINGFLSFAVSIFFKFYFPIWKLFFSAKRKKETSWPLKQKKEKLLPKMFCYENFVQEHT